MFNLKKLALVCVASLAAFSMSCSEDNEDGNGSSSSGVNPSSSSPGGTPVPLKKDSLVLSTAGESYGDVDTPPIGYKRAGLTLANAGSIDLIAFANNVVYTEGLTYSNTKIYVPSKMIEVNAANSDDIFWDLHWATCNSYDACPGSPYLTMGWELPPPAIPIIENAKNSADISAFTSLLESFVEEDPNIWDDEPSFSMANDSGFLLLTSKGKLVAIILKGVGTSSVMLKITYMPE
jgi:hypothetical protein